MARMLRSSVTTQGRKMAGARALWRATGIKEERLSAPIIAIANSFTQFVPGHTHLHSVGQKVKARIEELGCNAAEFNTIAVDDGIAMGHDGMLYSLPSRELIADAVEYMVNAHCADALVCISNCDKITPGMLMAALRLNIPTVFVSGGPMEAGQRQGKKYDLVDAMVMGADQSVSDEELSAVEKIACPTCGSCSGMFTANSMNCLTEALGLALPGNGTILATHSERTELFIRAADTIVELVKKYYAAGDDRASARGIATRAAFHNAMSLDIAMGGSTNTILHLLAAAQEAEVNFTMADIDQLSRRIPTLCKVAPSSSYHVEDVHRAGGVMAILAELNRSGLIEPDCFRVDGVSVGEAISRYDIIDNPDQREFYRCAPGGKPSAQMGWHNNRYRENDLDRQHGCIRSVANCYSRDGGLAVLFGNIAPDGCIVKTAGVSGDSLFFSGRARVVESQEDAIKLILGGSLAENDVVVIIYEGPCGGPGMQEMLYPTSYLKSTKMDKVCALVTDGRFSGGTSGLSIGHVSPEAAAGGPIALLADGDQIIIDINNRSIDAVIEPSEWQRRRQQQLDRGSQAFQPLQPRPRRVSKALQAYALLASSADKGAVRQLPVTASERVFAGQ